MAVIVRSLAVLFASLLACLAAGIVLTLGTLTPPWDEVAASQEDMALLAALAVVATVMVTAVAMLPTLLIAIVAEIFAWRSSLIYAALGGVLALLLARSGDFVFYFDDIFGRPARETLQRNLAQMGLHQHEVLAAAGIAGGLVYWLVAGRRAGAWKRGVRT
jgi:hypothetical protein